MAEPANITPGLSATVQHRVDESSTASHKFSGSVDVLATPELVRLMEQAAVTALGDRLPPGAPTVGAVITILLAESLRVVIGVSMVGLDTTIYGLMLVLFIIFLPKGILGSALELWAKVGRGTAASGRLGGGEQARAPRLAEEKKS